MSRESGEGRLGCIVSLVLLIAGGIFAFKMVPVKVAHSELNDFMIDQSKFGSGKTEKVKKAILLESKRLGLPLLEKNIEVRITRSRLQIEAHYTVTVEFVFGITYDWNLTHSIDRPRFHV